MCNVRNAIFILMFFIPVRLFASVIPVITSITQDGITYNYTHQLMEVGVAGDVIVPTGWYVGVIIDQFNGSIWQGQVFWSTARYVGDGKKTFSEISLKSWGDGTSTKTYVGSGSKIHCVGWGYQNGASYTGVPWPTNVGVPGGCLIVPPNKEWCKITTPELLLDHGTLTLQQAEGDSASTNMNVECSTAMAITFNLISDDKYVYLDEGKSEITVDNKPLNTKIDLDEGKSQLMVKDLLTGVTTEGAHTGSSVLVMQPY